jgi:hypothetical protein
MLSTDLLTGLQIAVAVVLLIVLYHALFAIVSIRKIAKRAEVISKNAEEIVLKPLALIETVMETIGIVKSATSTKSKKTTSKNKS